jgi:hypothetical protein
VFELTWPQPTTPTSIENKHHRIIKLPVGPNPGWSPARLYHRGTQVRVSALSIDTRVGVAIAIGTSRLAQSLAKYGTVVLAGPPWASPFPPIPS